MTQPTKQFTQAEIEAFVVEFKVASDFAFKVQDDSTALWISRGVDIITYLQERERVLTEALDNAIKEIERNTCTHEDTHRGGAIWTICEGCGMKWADDEGGFQPYQDSELLIRLRAALNQQVKP